MANKDIYKQIKPKPTKYKGRLYRSRLEARFAIYFELNGWTAEYEPLDFIKWSPDFLVTTNEGYKFLVEIKPLDSMFEIKKYIKEFDFDNYYMALCTPESAIVIGKDMVKHFDLTTESNFTEAANQIMFLKPEVSNG